MRADAFALTRHCRPEGEGRDLFLTAAARSAALQLKGVRTKMVKLYPIESFEESVGLNGAELPTLQSELRCFV